MSVDAVSINKFNGTVCQKVFSNFYNKVHWQLVVDFEDFNPSETLREMSGIAKNAMIAAEMEMNRSRLALCHQAPDGGCFSLSDKKLMVFVSCDPGFIQAQAGFKKTVDAFTNCHKTFLVCNQLINQSETDRSAVIKMFKRALFDQVMELNNDMRKEKEFFIREFAIATVDSEEVHLPFDNDEELSSLKLSSLVPKNHLQKVSWAQQSYRNAFVSYDSKLTDYKSFRF